MPVYKTNITIAIKRGNASGARTGFYGQQDFHIVLVPDLVQASRNDVDDFPRVPMRPVFAKKNGLQPLTGRRNLSVSMTSHPHTLLGHPAGLEENDSHGGGHRKKTCFSGRPQNNSKPRTPAKTPKIVRLRVMPHPEFCILLPLRALRPSVVRILFSLFPW